MSRDERDARARFSERYAIRRSAVMRQMEARVMGATWGVNGYTTLQQADELGRRLALGAGKRLLDVGTGQGWPGLYLAATTGCSVVGTDMPIEPLTDAAHRAGAERMAGRASFVAAGGAAQPFRARSFDAVVLTDVLC